MPMPGIPGSIFHLLYSPRGGVVALRNVATTTPAAHHSIAKKIISELAAALELHLPVDKILLDSLLYGVLILVKNDFHQETSDQTLSDAAVEAIANLLIYADLRGAATEKYIEVPEGNPRESLQQAHVVPFCDSRETYVLPFYDLGYVLPALTGSPSSLTEDNINQIIFSLGKNPEDIEYIRPVDIWAMASFIHMIGRIVALAQWEKSFKQVSETAIIQMLARSYQQGYVSWLHEQTAIDHYGWDTMLRHPIKLPPAEHFTLACIAQMVRNLTLPQTELSCQIAPPPTPNTEGRISKQKALSITPIANYTVTISAGEQYSLTYQVQLQFNGYPGSYAGLPAAINTALKTEKAHQNLMRHLINCGCLATPSSTPLANISQPNLSILISYTPPPSRWSTWNSPPGGYSISVLGEREARFQVGRTFSQDEFLALLQA